ncbi:hypothetical protein [Waterburya agarophytonicola]|uniref:hypothetical protein n=1 Tax=Waterburya agarophytonicola TaxID=2886916 RepID=UPI001E4B7492|nr:hypothetical protein [Waterburya agarophytonicola]
MIHRNSIRQARLNGAKARKKKKNVSKVTIYEEINRPGSMPAKHLRSFRALDRYRKPR